MRMDKITALEQRMEKNFRNYYDDAGYYEEEDFDNFTFSEYEEDEFVNQVSAPTRRPVSRMNPNARIITLVITNTTNQTQNVTILNAGEGTTPSFGSIPLGCSVTLTQGSYSRLLSEILQKPFQIHGLKYKAKDASQFDNVILLGYRNALGTDHSNKLTPTAWSSNLQNVSNQIDIQDFQYDVNIDSYISIPVNGTNVIPGGERVSLTFFLRSQIQPSRAFYAQPELASSTEGFITGLPQQQIVIKPKPAVMPSHKPKPLFKPGQATGRGNVVQATGRGNIAGNRMV